MPYHVEIRQGLRRARQFNLEEEELRARVLDPWRAGRMIRLGDRQWEPRESELRILDGAELSHQDLAYGQAWANAERSGRDVARELLADAVSSEWALVRVRVDPQRPD